MIGGCGREKRVKGREWKEGEEDTELKVTEEVGESKENRKEIGGLRC